MKYKIIYHSGDSIDIKTKADSGSVSLSSDSLFIKGKNQISIPFLNIKTIDLFRLHGLGRMVKIVHIDGTLFLSVIRFNLFGYFAVINFFKTGKLYNLLKSQVFNQSPNSTAYTCG